MASLRSCCSSALRGPAIQRQAAAASRRAAAAASRRLSVSVRAGKAEKITGEELEVAITERTTPLIVDFFATWCGPCLLMAQELDKVADQMGDRVRIVKIDVDENPQLSTQLRIEGLPTVVFIPKDASRPALRTEGLLPAQQILDILTELENSEPAKQ